MTCTQPLLVHADGTGTCAVAGCVGHEALTESVQRHRHVVNCRTVLGANCPVCHTRRPGSDDADWSDDPFPSTTRAVCSGTVIVHVDLSLVCSTPGCGPTASARGAWLAAHDDIRSCGSLDTLCERCTGPPSVP